MTLKELNELEEWRLGPIAKKLAMLTGYRTAVVREILKNTGEERKKHEKRLEECQNEMKKLLLLN